MDTEDAVEQIIEAFNEEPESDYGSQRISQHIRERGIRARIWDILEEYAAALSSDRVNELEKQLEALEGR